MFNQHDHTTDAGLSCTHISGCWCRGLLMSGKFWAAVLASFVAIVLFDWLWRNYALGDAITQTEVMWRPDSEVNLVLTLLAQALIAFSFTWLVLAAMRTARWTDALVTGLMLGVIGVALAIAMWNVMPFATNDYAMMWGLGFLLKSLLVAAVVKLVNIGCGRCCAKKSETVTDMRV